MPKMVVTHPVVDIELWFKGKAERATSIGQYATNVTDYVAADGSNSAAITADIHDMPGLRTRAHPTGVSRTAGKRGGGA